MRVKKQKRHRKVVRFYSACFEFREPYKVLCDGTFIHHLLLHRLVPADDALRHLLGARTTLFSSGCITAELKSLGKSHSEALQASHQLLTARCDHEKRVNAASCIEAIIGEGNPEHFFVATQDTELRKKMREIPGVPVIYGLRNALFLEQPSVQQREFVKSFEEKHLNISEMELQMLRKKELKDRLPVQVPTDSAGAHDPLVNEVESMHSIKSGMARRRLGVDDKSKFKRKKAKGPNPLSCKKKKIKESFSVAQNEDVITENILKRERIRKRKRSQKDGKLGEPGS